MTSAASRRAPSVVGLSTALAVFGSLVVYAVAYRLRIGVMLGDTFASDVPTPVRSLLRQSAPDVMFAVVGSGLVLIVALLAAGLARFRMARLLGIGVLAFLLLNVGILSQSQHATFFATGNGLNSQLVGESLSGNALKELLTMMTMGEWAYLVMPLVLFIGLVLLPAALRRYIDRGIIALSVVLVLFGCLVPAAPLPEALIHHPVAFLLLDLQRGVRRDRSLRDGLVGNAGAEPIAGLEGDIPPPSDEKDNDEAWRLAPGALPPPMALLTPQFVYSESEQPVKKTLPPLPSTAGTPEPPYNVLFVLMESTGLDYALQPVPGTDKRAMPFLHSLAEKGYLLSNHFSSGNSSPRGIFSLLSGLYVMPDSGIYDVRKDIYLPSLSSYLNERYHRFLVTPGSLDWYFPHAFLLHSGLGELWGYHALPVRKNAPGGRAHARDEGEAVSFFLRRLDEQAAGGAPFLAIYYSFLAHWPYPDYGLETHVVQPTRPLYAYYNNLRYLDMQIERIYKHLEEQHLLEHTILVLVGDHGEAFGQHTNNYTHSRMSFNENLHTPAILYQPKLFPPRVITEPTSHVDIVPTLLDSLGVKYDPLRLQGESLFQDHFHRKYIFIYGNEETLTSVSAQLVKLQISLRDGSCWVYDLKSDPEERRRQSCQGHAEQQQALLLYRRHQQNALRRYNQFAARQSHPN